MSASDGELLFFEDPNNCGNYSLNVAAMPAEYATSRVKILDASCQEKVWLQEKLPIFYKSDTQGHDEKIATSLSLEFWHTVKCGILELWRLDGKEFDADKFVRILDSFPFRVFEKNPKTLISSRQIIDYLKGNDKVFDDLILWR